MHTYKPEQLLPSAADVSRMVRPFNERAWADDEAFPESSLLWLSMDPIRIVTSSPKPKGTVKNVSNGPAGIRGYRSLRLCSLSLSSLKHTIWLIKGNV